MEKAYDAAMELTCRALFLLISAVPALLGGLAYVLGNAIVAGWNITQEWHTGDTQ